MDEQGHLIMSYDVKLSKFLSYILRHKPESIGLKLDENGWANVDDIISLSSTPITYEQIVFVVEGNEKKRFTLDGSRIRANQGHSVEVDVQLKEATPPRILYHGTVSKVLSLIQKEGLKPMSRQHVHLSADKETAEKVAARRGKPVILKINTFDLVKSGKKFYISLNGVWLTDHIPPEAISQ